MDQNNPISTYHGAEDPTIFSQMFKKEEHTKLIGKNETAYAQFFKFMVAALLNMYWGGQ